jgi:PEP-CTERM motif-containing protein
MKKLLLATALAMGLAAPASAAVIANLGPNPSSGSGAFANDPGAGSFTDQYQFQLTGGTQFLTIASATNTFAAPSDFIANFRGSVYQQVGAIGSAGGDDLLVLGPANATANCGLDCQGFGGNAILTAGLYYLQIEGFAGGTAGYGGTISTANVGAVPEPSTWAMMVLGFAGIGYMAMRKRRREGSAFGIA